MKRTAINRRIVYLAGFLFSLPLALTSYINSSFLENYISSKYVGVLYTCAAVLTITSLMFMPRLLSKLGNLRVSIILSLIFSLSLLVLGLDGNGAWVLPAFIMYFVCSILIVTTLDIFIEDFSGNKSVGKLRGTYLTITSLAWVLSQVISGSIISRTSYGGIYFISGILSLLMACVLYFFLQKFKDPVYKKMVLVRTCKTFLKNKNLGKAYLINLILKFFYAWMVIYTPIYLHGNLGFGWDEIGIIFSIMLLPFVLVTFPLGKLSDKIGEKKILALGFLIATGTAFTIPFIQEHSILIWALVLFATRVGAATIEIMSESHFFKIVKEEDVDEISFFRNTGPVSFIIAPLVAIPVLLYTPSFEFIFFALSAILLLGLFITLRLKDVK